MIQLKPLGLQSLHQQRSITAAEPKRRRIEVLGSENQADKTFDHSPAHRLTRIPWEWHSIARELLLNIRIGQCLRSYRHRLQLQPQSGCEPATVECAVSGHTREAENGAGINNHQWASLC